jgi:hypothetical protein
MASTAVARLDVEIVESARLTSEVMSRSTSQQLTHWARIGREVEAAASMTPKEIAEALSGSASYDQLNSGEQAVVRALWSEALDTRMAELDYESRFWAEGRPYAELDERGQVVVRSSARP